MKCNNLLLSVLALCLGLLSLTSCSESEEQDNTIVEMRRGLSLGLSPSVHTDLDASHRQALRPMRVPGDPGEPEGFVPPTTVYVIVWARLHDGKTYVQRFKTTASWALDGSASDLFDYQTLGDYYASNIDVATPKQCEEGRVFILATATDVTVNGLEDIPETGFFHNPDFTSKPLSQFATKYASNIKTPAEIETLIKGITFDIPSSSTNLSNSQILRSVYSVPFSLTADGRYENETEPKIVLYHTAARLDVDWDVQDEDHDRVGYYQVNNLLHSGISAFLPAEKDPTGAGTYSERYTTNEGSHFKHRQVFYVPQMGNAAHQFPLNFTINNSGTRTDKTASKNLGLGASPFTTWMRYNLTLN